MGWPRHPDTGELNFMRRHALFFLVFALILGAAAACGGGGKTIALPTTAVNPPEQPAEPTIPPSLPPTLPPTLPPPVMATPRPTETPAAPEEPVDEPEAAVNLLTAADFGENRNRLTGELVEDPAVLKRRPLAIKISNAPANWVRPQSGLNEADIVFEHITEGALTRFTVLVYGQEPEKVGPVRSARLIDVELPAMYDAALAFSGASVGVSRKLYGSDFSERLLASGTDGFYRTGEAKPLEHTLYVQPAGLWRALDGMGLNRPPDFQQMMTFTSEPPAGGTDASQITLDFRWEKVVWTYDPETNYYYRTAADQPHLDGNTLEQVRARNIVVPVINHVNDANICEEARNNQCVALSVEIQLWGQGPVAIFRDGRRYDGTWKREGRRDMLTFVDSSGQSIPLQIGSSWFELMSIYYSPVAVAP